MNERPSPVEAARRVTMKTDAAIRITACRSIAREAVKRIAEIGAGCLVEGVEEVEFSDRVEAALHDYMRAKTDPEQRRAYVGVTAGMDEIVRRLADIPAAPDAPNGDRVDG